MPSKREYTDDDFDPITGSTSTTQPTEVEPLTGSSQRSKARGRRWGLPDYWRAFVEEAVLERGGSMNVGREVVAKYIAIIKRDGFDDETIRAGFTHFATDVANGKVDVRRKPAWFVFFARRDRYVRKVYHSAMPDHVPQARSALPDEVPPNVNPLGTRETPGC